MNELFAFVSTDRRRVTVGYRMPDGIKVVRVHRKIDGHDRESITAAIENVKSMGVKEVLVEVYRPNGSAEKLIKTFVLPNDGRPMQTTPAPAAQLGSLSLFETPAMPKAPAPPTVLRPQPTPHTTPKPSSMESWKDYALNVEREKVSKLEAEVKRLTLKNENLDSQVRVFEKDMIKKDHELEKLQSMIESKSGLGGFLEKSTENPKMMEMLAGIASRVLGLPETAPQQTIGQAPLSDNPKVQQYATNIATWINRQPEELQDQFYQLIVEVTNSGEVSANILKIIDLIKNGTLTQLKRTA